jgi:hypothetical protein
MVINSMLLSLLFTFKLLLLPCFLAQRQLQIVQQDPSNFVIKSSSNCNDTNSNFNSTLFYAFNIANGIPTLKINGTTTANSTTNNVEYRLRLDKVGEISCSSSSSSSSSPSSSSQNSNSNNTYDFSGKQSLWSSISLQNRTASDAQGNSATLLQLSAQLTDSNFTKNSNLPWTVNVSIMVADRDGVIIPEWANNCINASSAAYIPYFINFPYSNSNNNLQIQESILTPNMNSMAIGKAANSNGVANFRGYLAINETVIADGQGAGLSIANLTDTSVSNNSTGNSGQSMKLTLQVMGAGGAKNVSFFEQMGIDLVALSQYNNSGNGSNSSPSTTPSSSGMMSTGIDMLKLGWMVLMLIGGLITVF